jgi:hypothetical protein
MTPGTGHLFGTFNNYFLFQWPSDFLTALESWVENNQAPIAIKATSTDGSIIRPLCPYPQIAMRKEGGECVPDPNYANYECVAPSTPVRHCP